jgi:biopolymer transport protein ExbD
LMPAVCLNSWQTDGCQWSTGYLWRSSDWFERLVFVALALMLAYTVFVFSHFFCRYYSARHQSRAFVPDSTRAVQRSQRRLVADLSRGVGTLKLIASTAPFLGLAGTCDGILGGFIPVGMERRAALARMAADIAAALITTAAGLLVAIPAAVSYNVLHTRIEMFGSDLSNMPRALIARSFQFAQKLPLQKRFSGMPPFALVAAAALASLVAIFTLFQPYDVPTGLHIGLASARCEYEGDDRLIVLRITDAGKLFLNTEQEDWNSLPGRLSEIYSMRVHRTLYLHADDGVPFQTVADALDIVENTPVTVGTRAVRMGTDKLNIHGAVGNSKSN